jgi:hypothetical protein
MAAERKAVLAGKHKDAVDARADIVHINTYRAHLQSLLYRKDSESRNFFRRVNLVYDLQKQKMFEYYRQQMGGAAAAAGEYDTPETVPEGTGNGKKKP